MAHNLFNSFVEETLPDPRSGRRAEKLMLDLSNYGNVVVNKFCKTHAEKIGAYRMPGNRSFDHEDLAEGVYRCCKKNVQQGHYLCIQDTSEYNYTNHTTRIGDEDQDMGPITNNNNVGFFCHHHYRRQKIRYI